MDVAIVGGGFAGLFTASELGAAGFDVAVLEADALPGGVARTVRLDGHVLEPAVGSMLLPDPHLTPILRRHDIAVEPATVSDRFVYRKGRLRRVRSGPAMVATDVLGSREKLRIALEPFVRSDSRPGETLARFARRRFGRSAGDLIAGLAAAGVYGGDPERLELESAFPALAALERQHGSVMRGVFQRRGATSERRRIHRPVHGFDQMADRLAGSLGDRFRTGAAVQSVRRDHRLWHVEGEESLVARNVVVALPPWHAHELIGGQFSPMLESIPSAPVVVLFLGGPIDRLRTPDAFGALVAGDGSLATLGILFESSVAPERAPSGRSLMKVIAGGTRRPGVVDESDERIVRRLGREAAQIMGVDVEVDFAHVVRHRRGIPQPLVGHRRSMESVDRELARSPGLHLTGWGYRGVGLGHVAADAVRVRRSVEATRTTGVT